MSTLEELIKRQEALLDKIEKDPGNFKRKGKMINHKLIRNRLNRLIEWHREFNDTENLIKFTLQNLNKSHDYFKRNLSQKCKDMLLIAYKTIAKGFPQFLLEVLDNNEWK